ncbi:hypothetical protein [Kitasatospora sp. NPDC002040]|uniref:hypothetical protein n=1 Tax=Kitasatospora sp. NPDC002040 TaxID=3154661 RepID=UPI003331222E
MVVLDQLAAAVVQFLTAAATGAGTATASLLGDVVRSRLTGAGLGSAVSEFEAAPQEPAAQAGLQTALVAVMTNDQPLVLLLAGSLPPAAPEAPAAPGRGVVPAQHFNSGQGVTVQGSGNKVRGNFAGRDQIITNIRRGDTKTLLLLALVVLGNQFA